MRMGRQRFTLLGDDFPRVLSDTFVQVADCAERSALRSPILLNILREQIITFLSAHRVGVLTTSGTRAAWAMPVCYRNDGLQVDCLLPKWADAAFYLEQDPCALLVIPDALDFNAGESRWLQYAGVAELDCSRGVQVSEICNLKSEIYVVVRLTPHRIDLIDERRGWGARETLELD